MTHRIKQLLLLVFSLSIFVGCSFVEEVLDDFIYNDSDDIEQSDAIEEEPHESNGKNENNSIDALVDTENFQHHALEHILEGELNRKGQAVGFHYEGLPTKKGEVIEGSATEPNEFGVYEGKVIVSGVEKVSNNGKSTFFPQRWSAQEVVNAINEAYENRTYITGNTYEGLTEEGMIIQMYLNNNEKIISAFPIY